MLESEYQKVDDIREILNELVEGQKRMSDILLLLIESTKLNTAIECKHIREWDATKKLVDINLRLNELIKR